MELGAVAKLLYQQATAMEERTSFCASNNCCHLECYVPVPILVLDSASLSPRRKPGPISLTTSVLGARTFKGDHIWDADLHMVPGWAAGPRGAQLVLEGSMRHRSAPAQGIGALRVIFGEDGVQGPMVTAAMNGLWDFMSRRRGLK